MPDQSPLGDPPQSWVDLTKQPGFHAAQQPHGRTYEGVCGPAPTAWPVLPTDLLAALRFLKWCDANDHSTELAEVWLLTEVRKLP
jgi:hypothetical protein